MQILAHRGFWKIAEEKNSKTAFERAFDAGFGIETDLRDKDGEIVIAHDMDEQVSLHFCDVLELLDKRPLPLALNIKADGLGDAIQSLLNKYKHDNYFLFDMSVPELFRLSQTSIKLFTGLSDIQPNPVLLEQCAGIWLDCFHSDWYGPGLISHYLQMKKAISIVSAELHRRNYAEQWRMLKTIRNIKNQNLFLCTDIPIDAYEYFGGVE